MKRRLRRAWRRLAWVGAWAVGLVVVAGPAALGSYHGSDVLGNIGPESQVAGGLVDKYPLSAYALDYHVDVGVTNPDGVPPMIAQWAAAQLWSATSFLVKSTIDLFTWAFSLDLLNGSGGALGPVSSAITSLYENVIGQAWMVAAILVAGIWGIWKALMQRRYTETAGALALSVAFVLVAMFFVYQPERTIGQASQWTNQLSLAFLSGANAGSLDDPQRAKRDVADQLFETLVYRPWVVLEFGGLSHCVDTGRRDSDGFPTPVGPHDPTRDVCRDHVKAGADGHGGYAPRFLRQAPGSDERDAEYDALRKGELPVLYGTGNQFAGYKVDKADTPAVDIQQAGGAYQRLTVAVVVFAGALGAVALLGFLSLAVILAQVVALVLLGFAPIALIVGIFPGAGHQVFKAWLSKLATAVFIKALYSLVIAIVVAVAAALTSATDSLGFLFAFGLQTLFFWAIFIYRKQITARMVSATTGAAHQDHMPRMTAVQRGANVAARPFSALVGVTRRGGSGEDGESRQQQSALVGGESGATSPATASTAASGSSPATVARPSAEHGVASVHANDAHVHAHGNVDVHSPAAPERRFTRSELTPGDPLRTSSPTESASDPAREPASRHDAGPIPIQFAASRRAQEHGDLTPRASHEDVMRRARELRERQRETVPASEERSG